MRIFKWSIILSARLAEIHARSRKLDRENQTLTETNKSLLATILIQEESIEEQKAKSSLVKVSERENSIKSLKEIVKHLEGKLRNVERRGKKKEMSGNGLQNADPDDPGVLQIPLVFATASDAPIDFTLVSAEGAGFKDTPGQLLPGGDAIEPKGD